MRNPNTTRVSPAITTGTGIHKSGSTKSIMERRIRRRRGKTEDLVCGAQERTRTSTPLRELAPEASASANSATWALLLSTTYEDNDLRLSPNSTRARWGGRAFRTLTGIDFSTRFITSVIYVVLTILYRWNTLTVL